MTFPSETTWKGWKHSETVFSAPPSDPSKQAQRSPSTPIKKRDDALQTDMGDVYLQVMYGYCLNGSFPWFFHRKEERCFRRLWPAISVIVIQLHCTWCLILNWSLLLLNSEFSVPFFFFLVWLNRLLGFIGFGSTGYVSGDLKSGPLCQILQERTN